MIYEFSTLICLIILFFLLNHQSTQKFKSMTYGIFYYTNILALPFTCGFENLLKAQQV